LKTGGEANAYQVEAIVTKAGKRFRNGRPYLLARFDQRNFGAGPLGRTVIALPVQEEGSDAD